MRKLSFKLVNVSNWWSGSGISGSGSGISGSGSRFFGSGFGIFWDFIYFKKLFLEFVPERTVVVDNQIQVLIKVGFIPIFQVF